MKALAEQFVRFLGAGAGSAVVHFGILIVLVETGTAEAVAASMLAALGGAVVNYALNYRYTFRSTRAHGEAASRFAGVALTGFVLNGVLMWLLADLAGLHYLPAQVVTTALVVVWSFAANRHWTFRAPVLREGGFTLLELLVVMVIVGLLAGYVAPKYFAQVGKSEVKATRAQIDALEKALDQYRLDMGRYPTTEQGLAALMTRPAADNAAKWQGPYLRKAVPPDPWGQPYQYKQPGDHGDIDVFSWGRDGKPGGSGEDADIGNW